MSQFITYKHASGEFAFIKRESITSFKPLFINQHCYQIVVTVGNEKFPVANAESLAAAEAWIIEQIKLIDGDIKPIAEVKTK